VRTRLRKRLRKRIRKRIRMNGHVMLETRHYTRQLLSRFQVWRVEPQVVQRLWNAERIRVPRRGLPRRTLPPRPHDHHDHTPRRAASVEPDRAHVGRRLCIRMVVSINAWSVSQWWLAACWVRPPVMGGAQATVRRTVFPHVHYLRGVMFQKH